MQHAWQPPQLHVVHATVVAAALAMSCKVQKYCAKYKQWLLLLHIRTYLAVADIKMVIITAFIVLVFR